MSDAKEVVIRVCPHSEGGFSMDIYVGDHVALQNVDPGADLDPDDGGVFETESVAEALDEAVEIAKNYIKNHA